jgi:hypothetical protein
MQPDIKKFAYFTDSNWTQSREPVEIKDEKDAVQIALQNHAICFTLFDVPIVTLNGQEFKGEPQDFTGRRYVGFERLYTRDEVIQHLQSNTNNPFDQMDFIDPEFDADGELSDLFADATNDVLNAYKRDPADSIYIYLGGRDEDFSQLKPTEKVFTAQGIALYPPAAPIPAPQAGIIKSPKI